MDQSLNTFREYKQAIEDVRPHKRPVLLWSAASLVYVHGDLHITSLGVWGTQVSGVTDEKLAWFFLLAVGYYLIRGIYWNWIILRPSWRAGLWKWSISSANYILVAASHEKNQPVNSSVLADIHDRARVHRTSWLTIFLSYYGIPFVFPLAVALRAITVLCSRLSS